MTWRNPQFLLQSVHDFLCSTQRTRRRCANLQKILSHRLTIEHGVKCSYFVNSHRWHFKDSCNFVHDTDTRPSQLSLPEIQEWYHCCFFVLRGIFTGMLAFNCDRQKYLMICSTRFMFSGLNENGICGLLSGVSRCWMMSMLWLLETYDEYCITSSLNWGVNWALARDNASHPKREWMDWIWAASSQQRGHGRSHEPRWHDDKLDWFWMLFGACQARLKFAADRPKKSS